MSSVDADGKVIGGSGDARSIIAGRMRGARSSCRAERRFRCRPTLSRHEARLQGRPEQRIEGGSHDRNEDDLLIALAASASLATAAARGPSSACMWYSDGNEGEVMPDLLTRFEAENPDIKVVLDNVAYDVIQTTLPVQLEAGNGPDMARVTNIKAQAQHWLDLRPHLKDAGLLGDELRRLPRLDAAGRQQRAARLHDAAHRHRPLHQQDAVRPGRRRVPGRRRDLGRVGGGGEEGRGQPEACRSRSAGTAPAIASPARRSRWAPNISARTACPRSSTTASRR